MTLGVERRRGQPLSVVEAEASAFGLVFVGTAQGLTLVLTQMLWALAWAFSSGADVDRATGIATAMLGSGDRSRADRLRSGYGG